MVSTAVRIAVADLRPDGWVRSGLNPPDVRAYSTGAVPMQARTRPRVDPVEKRMRESRWSSFTRVAFRFCFVYFGSYCFATHIAGGLFPNLSLPALGARWPMREITLWLAAHVFGVATPLVYAGNSGDTAFHWIQTAWILAASAVMSAAWSYLDRHRPDPLTLYTWFRLFMRFALA